MEARIIYDNQGSAFDGCDAVVEVKDSKLRLLQITDTQVIDSTQQRKPDRLRPDEYAAWLPEYFDKQCGDHVRSIVNQTKPDLIFITGDFVYGSFDDSGRVMEWFCHLMDSFKIPWAPVFGNHDNECRLGVNWQCEQLERSRYCVFKRGGVTGNSNYTVGIAKSGKLLRVMYMLDSNGCKAEDPKVTRKTGLYPDQLEAMREKAVRIRTAQKRDVKAFMAFHVPVDLFFDAAKEKGYLKEGKRSFIIGVDTPALDGDFGFFLENEGYIATDGFYELLKELCVDGVFMGHNHNNCGCISHKGIKWVFGMKTGQYDYHVPGQNGATLVTVDGDDFQVACVPSLVPPASMPGLAPMFENLLTFGKKE